MRLEKLNARQTARLDEWRERWTAIGLCTEVANRPQAEAAIRRSYELAGKSPPRKIVWCGSPLSQGLTRTIILDKKVRDSVRDSVGDSVGDSVWNSVGDSVRDSVWNSVGNSVRDSVGNSVGNSVRNSVGNSVRDSVGNSVWDSVGDSVGDSVWNSVWDSVWNSVGDSVWNSVGNSVWNSVWNSVGNSVRDSVWNSVWDSVYGQHDANWLGFFEYFREVCGLQVETEKLTGLIEQAKHAGWFLPHENICWVSERHNLLLRDERGRLHSLTSPAVAYPDGWKIYAVHGVRVPSDLIEHPETIDPLRITKERNAEIRRVMMEIFTPKRFLLESGAVPIHADDYGTLYRAEFPDDEPLAMVEVINATAESTGEFSRYWLRVPPEMTTAHQAVAWTFDKTVDDYMPLVQT